MENIKTLCTIESRENGISPDFDSGCAEKPSVGSSPTSRKTRWYCEYDDTYYRTRKELYEHIRTLPYYNKHGYKPKLSRVCPYCEKVWETTKSGWSYHKKFCKQNPNREERKVNLTEQGRKIISETAHRNCEEKHFWEYRAKHPILYVKKNGEKVKLDSKLEEACASKLDELNIEWYRPKYTFDWVGNDGSKHKYYPDFFIPSYKCFIECKSKFVEKSQNKNGKCDYLKSHYKFIKWIQTYDDVENLQLTNMSFGFIPLEDKINQDILQWIENLAKQKQEPIEHKPRIDLSLEKQRRTLIEDAIKNKTIDFYKFGWVQEVSKLFGIASNKAGRYIRKHYPDLYKTFYVRKPYRT